MGEGRPPGRVGRKAVMGAPDLSALILQGLSSNPVFMFMFALPSGAGGTRPAGAVTGGDKRSYLPGGAFGRWPGGGRRSSLGTAGRAGDQRAAERDNPLRTSGPRGAVPAIFHDRKFPIQHRRKGPRGGLSQKAD